MRGNEMTLEDIISQSSDLLKQPEENSPTDALRLVHHLAKCLQQHTYATSHTTHTGAEE